MREHEDLEDWSAGCALVALVLLVCGLFWWPLIIYSWHYGIG